MASRSMFCLTAAIALVVILNAPVAAQTQDIHSPVILAVRTSWRLGASASMQIMPDLTGKQDIITAFSNADLTRNGVKGQRYFLYTRGPMNGEGPNELLSTNENADPATTVVLTPNSTIYHAGPVINFSKAPRWSPDGQRVLFAGRRFDSAGSVVSSGLFVGDVLYSGPAPAAVVNERLLVADLPDTATHNYWDFQNFSWTSDGQRVVFMCRENVWDGSGFAFNRYIPLTAPVAPPTFDDTGNVLDSPIPATEIRTSGTLGGPLNLIASPAAGDSRVAFRAGDGKRQDAWTISLPSTYDGSAVLPAQRATNSSTAPNTTNMARLEWSPDGAFLAYDALAGSYIAVYKVPANNTGKASTLFKVSGWDCYLGVWRQ